MSWLVFALIFWGAAWAVNAWLAQSPWRHTRVVRILVPVLFGVTLIVLWEGLVRGLGVSPVILPAPSTVAQTFAASTGILWEDFRQTVVKGALTGFAIGSAAALLLAARMDRAWERKAPLRALRIGTSAVLLVAGATIGFSTGQPV